MSDLLGTPAGKLDRAEWEALCDGCGKCCLHKVEDEDTGRIYPTNVACKLLDLKSCQCADYKARRLHVPDCIRLARGRIGDYSWLPSTCAYVLRDADEPLPDWHYLVSGSRETIHQTGIRSPAKQYRNSMLDLLNNIFSNNHSEPNWR